MDEDKGFLDKTVLSRSAWRRLGTLSLLTAGGLAVFAAVGGILRDSVIHAAVLFGNTDTDLPEPGFNGYFVVTYWLAFGLAVLIALYCALLDIKFIRLEYAAAKRALLQETFSTREPASPDDHDKSPS